MDVAYPPEILHQPERYMKIFDFSNVLLHSPQGLLVEQLYLTLVGVVGVA